MNDEIESYSEVEQPEVEKEDTLSNTEVENAQNDIEQLKEDRDDFQEELESDQMEDLDSLKENDEGEEIVDASNQVNINELHEKFDDDDVEVETIEEDNLDDLKEEQDTVDIDVDDDQYEDLDSMFEETDNLEEIESLEENEDLDQLQEMKDIGVDNITENDTGSDVTEKVGVEEKYDISEKVIDTDVKSDENDKIAKEDISQEGDKAIEIEDYSEASEDENPEDNNEASEGENSKADNEAVENENPEEVDNKEKFLNENQNLDKEKKLKLVEAKVSFNDKFKELAANEKSWNTPQKQEDFLQTVDIYADKSVADGAFNDKSEFYLQYADRNYEYPKEYVDKIKEPFLRTGASSIVNESAVRNVFDTYGTIGRGTDGNYVTSCEDDKRLCFDGDKAKSACVIADVKGVGENTYNSGKYQYEYDSNLVQNCDKLDLLQTPNGNIGGASSLNIPGCKTWAGQNMDNSESELMMPSIVTDGIDSDDVFDAINSQGYYEINNPTVLAPNGDEIQVEGYFKINRLE